MDIGELVFRARQLWEFVMTGFLVKENNSMEKLGLSKSNYFPVVDGRLDTYLICIPELK
jgi:hypothetical protein